MDRQVIYWVLPISLGALSGVIAGLRKPTTLPSSALTGFVSGCLTSLTVASLLVLSWMIEERFHPLTFVLGTVFILICLPAGGISGSIIGLIDGLARRRISDRPIRFRFSLETALYVMTITAIGLAIIYLFR
jgi:hypothetical protein